MTTEDLMNLAENYARLCYEGDDGPLVIDARQALLDALEAQGREVERMGRQILSDTDAFIHVRDQRDTLRAELAAIRAQEPVAETTCDCYPDHGGTIYAEAVLSSGTPLYASPAAKDAGLVADVTQDDAELLARVIEQFEDCGETDVDQATLMRFAAMGLLECTRFEATAKGNEIAAKTDAPLFAASPKIGGI